MIPGTNQHDLSIDTMQLDEVYVLRINISESWDVWVDTQYPWEDDNLNTSWVDYSGRQKKITMRRHDAWIVGVITDDRTLQRVKERLDDYANIWQDEARAKIVDPNSKPNYNVEVKYFVQKEHRIIL